MAALGGNLDLVNNLNRYSPVGLGGLGMNHGEPTGYSSSAKTSLLMLLSTGAFRECNLGEQLLCSILGRACVDTHPH